MISVLIPTYNNENEIARCLESLKKQTYKDFEVIIVNDGSNDKTLDICKQYAESDARFQLFSQENKGVSAARNVAIALAKGEWLTFVDADDYVTEDYLDYLLKLQSETMQKLVACNHFVVTDTTQEPLFPQSRALLTYNEHDALEQVLYHGNVDVSPWGKLYAKELFQNLQYPYGKIFEDTYLFGDVLAHAGGLVVGGEAKYFYSYRDHSLSKSKNLTRATQYIDAVMHLTEQIPQKYPDLHDACLRRNVHAYLSVRRLMTNCEAANIPLRKQLDDYIRKNAIAVLKNKQAPKRDKIAIATLLMGDWCFDLAWNIYVKKKYQ